MKKITIIILATLCISCTSAPNKARQANTNDLIVTRNVQAAADENRMKDIRCKRIRPTGSNYPKLVCFTKDEIEKNMHDTQTIYRRMVRSAQKNGN